MSDEVTRYELVWTDYNEAEMLPVETSVGNDEYVRVEDYNKLLEEYEILKVEYELAERILVNEGLWKRQI